MRPSGDAATLPDPGRAGNVGDLVQRLRLLKVWAGDPSYEKIKDRVNGAWVAAGRPDGELTSKSTVADCFRTGRRRLNTDLVVAVVQALHPDTGYVAQWRQALRVVGGEVEAASQVRVQDSLPRDLAAFIGRTGELRQLRQALHHGFHAGAVTISAIEGMAGVGKTQLAVHSGHLLIREYAVERVLFVNLRGFHPDPAQPPADPAAVLDGFLRLLGVPGQEIPHSLAARAAAYRRRLAGTRALVVLDNAATTDQVRPLLPDTPGCPTMVTSRRSLTDLHPATHLALDVFTPAEAVAFLTRAAPASPVGADPGAAARIARCCGCLPLALSLVAGHIGATPGWSLTDHADRLGERHHDQRLDTGVELALRLSYQHLPADQRRALRLLALHPGPDFDAYAAAALAGTDLPTARVLLRHLSGDHLLHHAAPGRYTFHDLIRAYAAAQGQDEDRPSDRRAALTRLFDYYLATSGAAMNTLHPAATHSRPRIPPAAAPSPGLTDPDAALGWLDTERPALVSVAARTATAGWPAHATRLARTLARYLDGGYNIDALSIHGHAHQAARRSGDLAGQAHAMADLGIAHMRLGRYGRAAEHFRQALDLFRRTDDPAGRARALINLGFVVEQSGDHRTATDHYRQALSLHRQAGDRTGEARALNSLGNVEGRAGCYRAATGHYAQALLLAGRIGDRASEAYALNGLGEVSVRAGRYGDAGDHYAQALIRYRELGNRTGEASALDGLGLLHTRLGRPAEATEYHRRALAICREIGERNGEAWTLNGLGEAAHAAGRAAEAVTHHAAAHAVATDIGDHEQQARAHTGLGHAHRTLGDPALAREHYRRALKLSTELGLPSTDEIRAQLTATISEAAVTIDLPEDQSTTSA